MVWGRTEALRGRFHEDRRPVHPGPVGVLREPHPCDCAEESMKTLTALFAASACAVAATAVVATAAHADMTFTVSPGGAWSGTRAPDSTVGIRDAVSNQTILCSGLTASGSFRSGTGLSGSNIGSLTGISFTGCQVRSLTVTVTVHTS